MMENSCLRTLDLRGGDSVIQAVNSVLSRTLEEGVSCCPISSLETVLPSNAAFIRACEKLNQGNSDENMFRKLNNVKRIESALERNRPKMVLTVTWETSG